MAALARFTHDLAILYREDCLATRLKRFEIFAIEKRSETLPRQRQAYPGEQQTENHSGAASSDSAQQITAVLIIKRSLQWPANLINTSL